MQDDAFRSRLLVEAGPEGLGLDPGCLEQIEYHFRLLVKWNHAVRLVGSTDPVTVVERHVMESLALRSYLHEPRGSLLDIGSGNGYPAIPLKCALPELRVGMMEPTVRKSAFLRTVVAELGLRDCEVHRDRVDKPQDLARFGKWDHISMRGVAAIPAVVAGAPGALRPGGRLLFMVGEQGHAQIRSAVSPPLMLRAAHRLSDSRGSLIVVVELEGDRAPETIH